METGAKKSNQFVIFWIIKEKEGGNGTQLIE
jgi:hypothetical protein